MARIPDLARHETPVTCDASLDAHWPIDALLLRGTRTPGKLQKFRSISEPQSIENAVPPPYAMSLQVVVKSASNLPAADRAGTSDPYVKLTYAGKRASAIRRQRRSDYAHSTQRSAGTRERAERILFGRVAALVWFPFLRVGVN